MKKILPLLLFLLSGLAFPLVGQSLPSMLVDAGAVSAGRGGTVLGASPDAFSARDYAAAMAFAPSKGMGAVSYGRWRPRSGPEQILSFATVCRLGGRFAAGLSGIGLCMGEYEVMSPNGTASQVNGIYSPWEAHVALSACCLLAEGLSVGVTGRFCRSDLGTDARANVGNADLSLCYLRGGFRAGIAARHLGGAVAYGDGAPAAQPFCLSAGLGYAFPGRLTVLAESAWFPAYGWTGAAGLEYACREWISLRGGAHFSGGPYLPSPYASAGVTGRYRGFSLDAAWIFAGKTLRDTLMFTLGCSF